MTTSEMIKLFKLKYDAAGSSAAPDFIDTEIIEFLNNAQLSIVDLLHAQKNFVLLATLIRTVTDPTGDSTGLSYPNKYFRISKTALPEYRYYIRSNSRIIRESKSLFVNHDYIPIDLLYRFLKTGNNIPRFNRCVVFDDSNNNLVIMGDGYVTGIENIFITYLKNPTLITPSITSELDSSLHEKIVEIAVDEAVKSIHRAKVPPQTQSKNDSNRNAG